MKTLRIGIVGGGGMGRVHYANWKAVEGAEVVALCGNAAAAEEWGVPAYKTISDMVQAVQLDVVDICTPSYMHAEMAIYCLGKGLHVLCEKPMTINEQEAEKVLEAASKTDKYFMAAHVVRFMAPYVYLRSVIESGELGKLLRLDMKRISGIPTWSWEDWMRKEDRSGGVITDLSIHDIDFVQSILGMPDKIMSAKYAFRNNNDFAQTEMIYGDTLVSCEGTWYNAPIGFRAIYTAVFQNGVIDSTSDGIYKNGVKVESENKEKAEEMDLGINVGNDNGYLNEMQYFVNCVNNGVSPDFVTPQSSANTMKLVGEIKKAAVNF